MKSFHRRVIATGLVCAALAVWGLDGAMGGPVTEIPSSKWPEIVGQLKSLRPDKAPYRLTHRCRAYDQEILLQTPLARVAVALQGARKQGKELTPEEAEKLFDPNRLLVESRTYHRSADKASAVEVNLLVDGKPIYPLRSDLITTQLRSVGFYADPLYYGIKQYVFDMGQVRGARTLTIVIVESQDKGAEVHELKVDLAKLQ